VPPFGPVDWPPAVLDHNVATVDDAHFLQRLPEWCDETHSNDGVLAPR
jgi:hypothetical protein